VLLNTVKFTSTFDLTMDAELPPPPETLVFLSVYDRLIARERFCVVVHVHGGLLYIVLQSTIT